MRKIIIIILAVFTALLVGLVAVPFIFKDKIIAIVDQKIASAVNAQVYYDYNNISFSVFKRFPHISATLKDFGVIGNPPFQNDTLIHVNNLQVDFNLKSILFGDNPSLTGLHLDGGSMYVKVFEDGRANYDIINPEEDQVETEESDFQIGVDLIEVNNFNFVYDDRQLKYFMALREINMLGSGDFTLDVYDLPLKMDALIVDITYGEINYLRNKSFSGETQMNIDLNQMKFTFREGNFALNELLFDLKGFVALPEEDIDFDLVFAGKDNSFKSILSLVPGIYTESFSTLNTAGNMDFKGFVKGKYSENTIPSFDVSLNVTDGMFQYPDLPRPVSNINLDMQGMNSTGNVDDTKINIPNFNLDFGSNPISGRFLLDNLVTYDIDGLLKGKLNLEEMTSIFPIEGMNLKGILDVNVTVKGRYDSIAQIIPMIDAKMLLTDGYVKSAEYPAPIEKLRVNATVLNTTGKMNDFLVDLTAFGFELEDEAISGKLKVNDFTLLKWDGAVNGTVDLGKLLKIFPMENVIMEGKVKADLLTKGSYEDVEKSRFDKLDTRGDLEVMGFYFTSLDFPQGIRIRDAKADFSPDRINLTQFDARVGESPLVANGFLSNYMNFFLKENETLKGQLTLISSRFNANEWMTESGEADTSALAVVELPKNIDFNMTVQATEVLYDNLNLKDVKGSLTLKDGVLNFTDASMRTLGGQMVLNGKYDPRDLTKPLFDFNFNVVNLSIREAFKSFNTVKILAPIAQHLTGNFSTSMDFSGILGQDMMPILSSLDGKGLMKVLEASLQNSAILDGIASLTKLSDSRTLQLKNLSLPIEINNGMLNVKPFDLKLWDYQANIQGSTGFDGSINYLVNMQVPAGKFGAQANSLLATIAKTEANESTLIPVAISLGGTYSSPKIGLAGGNSLESLLTNALKSRAASEKENLTAKATEQFKAAEDSLKQELKLKAGILQDSVKKEAEEKVSETKSKVLEEAKGLLRGVLGNKAKPVVKPDTTKKEDN